jgi:hypothetical protein
MLGQRPRNWTGGDGFDFLRPECPMLPEEEAGQRWNQMLAELLMLGGRSNSYFLRLSCSRGRALPASVKSEQNSRYAAHNALMRRHAFPRFCLLAEPN